MFSNNTKQDKMKRIISLVLVILLALSVCTTAIYFLAATVYASDEGTAYTSYSGTDDKLIRVGLMYGANVTVGFESKSDYGFVFNKVNRTGDLTHESLWESNITKLSTTVDANLSKSAMTYSKTSSPSNTVIGGYHVEIGSGLTRIDMEQLIYELTPLLSPMGLYPIPCYINGGYRVRVGHYSTQSAAEALLNSIAGYINTTVGIAQPTNTAVSVVDPNTDKIIFEYDDNDVTALGLTAMNSSNGEKQYIATPANNIYDGTFMFRRYITSSVDGVSLTNIIGLEEYIKGVLPYEISSSWPYEAQKAFAIMVRSFTLTRLRYHERSYQIDVCNTTNCQAYAGRTKITENVERAVEDTRGIVVTYGSSIVSTVYSSSQGGVTVGADDAWGGSAQPGLTAIETPWEQYTKHGNGSWTAEYSPNQIYTFLRNYWLKNQPSVPFNLKGNIASITVDQLAKNSTYVYQITFTDVYGNTHTVKNTDTVRSCLPEKVLSANFVVGKGSVEADETTFITVSADKVNVKTNNGTYKMGEAESTGVMTSNGYRTTNIKGSTVMTGNGKVILGDTTSVSTTKTFTATDPNNFIFVGKGWGHGVGASQWGIRDLADLGYQYEEIVKKYFPACELSDWRGYLN